MIYTYNKLVRDKIPQQINQIKGRKANYKILGKEDYAQELDKKLFEEAHEFIEEHSIEELADLLEVIFAIMENRNISIKDVEEVRKVKSSQKGSFHNRIYLINVEQDNIDEREEKEQKKQWRKNDP